MIFIHRYSSNFIKKNQSIQASLLETKNKNVNLPIQT